jgi:DNA-binding SARP family transcriptional activator
VEFRVLGPVEIEADDGGLCRLARRQERCVLAILPLEPGQVVPVDRLCEPLWEDGCRHGFARF